MSGAEIAHMVTLLGRCSNDEFDAIDRVRVVSSIAQTYPDRLTEFEKKFLQGVAKQVGRSRSRVLSWKQRKVLPGIEESLAFSLRELPPEVLETASMRNAITDVLRAVSAVLEKPKDA